MKFRIGLVGVLALLILGGFLFGPSIVGAGELKADPPKIQNALIEGDLVPHDLFCYTITNLPVGHSGYMGRIWAEADINRHLYLKDSAKVDLKRNRDTDLLVTMTEKGPIITIPHCLTERWEADEDAADYSTKVHLILRETPPEETLNEEEN